MTEQKYWIVNSDCGKPMLANAPEETATNFDVFNDDPAREQMEGAENWTQYATANERTVTR